MTYYTNSNYIEDLMKQIADVEVKLVEGDEWTNVTVYLFDNLFEPLGKKHDHSWPVTTVL